MRVYVYICAHNYTYTHRKILALHLLPNIICFATARHSSATFQEHHTISVSWETYSHMISPRISLPQGEFDECPPTENFKWIFTSA